MGFLFPTRAGRWSEEKTHSRNVSKCNYSDAMLRSQSASGSSHVPAEALLNPPEALNSLHCRKDNISDANTKKESPRWAAGDSSCAQPLQSCQTQRCNPPASQPVVHTQPNRRGGGGPWTLTPAPSQRVRRRVEGRRAMQGRWSASTHWWIGGVRLLKWSWRLYAKRGLSRFLWACCMCLWRIVCVWYDSVCSVLGHCTFRCGITDVQNL